MRRSELKSILMESPLYEGEEDLEEVARRNGLKLEDEEGSDYNKYTAESLT